jgi:hypothetical protein
VFGVALIDDRGRLFGLVNVVDVLVVLVVLVVVVAGIGFAFVYTEGEPATRYVTLDLGTQPAYITSLVEEGDTINGSNVENLTVTDVYVTTGPDVFAPDAGDGYRMYVRARVDGLQGENAVTFAGGPLRVGRALTVETDKYVLDGTVMEVDTANPDLAIGDTDLLVRTRLPVETAEAIQPEDRYRVGGRTLGTVRSVTAYRTGNGTAITYVGTTFSTLRSPNGPELNGKTVREGMNVSFETDMYAFRGQVARRGALTLPGEPTTRTATLKLENVDPDLASGLEPGLTERIRDETTARLVDVEVEPATVVVTSQDGNVFARDHPVEKDVTLTVELRVRETSAGLRFKNGTLREGGTVPLEFGIVSVEATVSRVRS